MAAAVVIRSPHSMQYGKRCPRFGINTRRIGAVGLYLAIYTTPVAAADAPASSIVEWPASGRDLYEKCASSDEAVIHACGEYLLGFLDGTVMALPTNAQIACPPSNLSFFRLEPAYLAWAKVHPELLNRPRGISAASALAAEFPCPKR